MIAEPRPEVPRELRGAKADRNPDDGKPHALHGDEPRERRRQEHDPHVGLTVRAVVVRETARRPGDPVGGNDRRAPLGVHGQDAAGGVHQMPLGV